jgi:hypothetical protein
VRRWYLLVMHGTGVELADYVAGYCVLLKGVDGRYFLRITGRRILRVDLLSSCELGAIVPLSGLVFSR